MKFVRAFCGEHGSLCGTEERVVLEKSDDVFDDLHCERPLLQQWLPELQSRLQGSGVGFLHLRAEVFFPEVAGPTVNGDGPVCSDG